MFIPPPVGFLFLEGRPMESGVSLLAVENLGKVYANSDGGVVALREVSFSVTPGEFVAVRGPSGCGKSTLLHILGAMDRPTSGSVRLERRELAALGVREMARLRRRQVGFVFQSFHLLPTLTVAENVMLPLTLDGMPDRLARPRARELLEQVGLTQRESHLPGQLSGGEMQRVAVARAVAARPLLLLADELTGNLDSDTGRRIMELLAELNRRLNLTVILATHSEEAAAFARRTLLFRDGRLQQDLHHAAMDRPV
jgi:putative ABC transport system ATP-binding protein